ncbi:hypothetical protein J2S09_002897 [Bacillus fengqiuensis]|nr:hypothetical protein [Bacillus fengqiuensis]
MVESKLFTALYFSKNPLWQGKLKKKIKGFTLDHSEQIGDKVYHLRFRKENSYINAFYFQEYKYLFVEVNELYPTFKHGFGPLGVQIWEAGMDAFLLDLAPETVIRELSSEIENNGYDEEAASPLCHIYGQQMWHDDAFIVGNVTALRELKDAIESALKYGESKATLFPSDGEGYHLYISCLDSECEDKDWQDLQLPYHDRECYVPDNERETEPYKLLKKYKHFFDDERK